MKWLSGSAGLCVCRPRPACYFLEVIRPTLPHQGKALMISGSHEICTARRSLTSRSLDSAPSSPPFTPLRCPFSLPHQLFPRLFSLRNCFPRPFPWNQPPMSVIFRWSKCLCPHTLYPSTFFGQLLPDLIWTFYFSFVSLKSKTMTTMSLKWSEHFEFNMCENIWKTPQCWASLWNVAIPTGIRASLLLICLLTLHHLFHWSGMSTELIFFFFFDCYLVVCGPISGILIRAYS